jgi:hypothetical protein
MSQELICAGYHGAKEERWMPRRPPFESNRLHPLHKDRGLPQRTGRLKITHGKNWESALLGCDFPVAVHARDTTIQAIEITAKENSQEKQTQEKIAGPGEW